MAYDIGKNRNEEKTTCSINSERMDLTCSQLLKIFNWHKHFSIRGLCFIHECIVGPVESKRALTIVVSAQSLEAVSQD